MYDAHIEINQYNLPLLWRMILLCSALIKQNDLEAGKSISIPCLYESQYIDHVKYLCEGHIWSSCSYAVKTNKPDPSGKYSISDDKKEQIFTVTIKNLTNQNTDYWCVVEINNGPDCGQYFQLSVTSGKCTSLLTFQILYNVVFWKKKTKKKNIF
uniref:Immunoglobulin subtype domain-containing protein n=1 Tax=Maylandia zebra TaxID=106582 RepID=A0A3P9DQH6_9CICH